MALKQESPSGVRLKKRERERERVLFVDSEEEWIK